MSTRTLKHSIKIQQNNLLYSTKKKRKKKTELVLRWGWRDGSTKGWGGGRVVGGRWEGAQKSRTIKRRGVRSYGVRGELPQRLRQLRRAAVSQGRGFWESRGSMGDRH